MSRPPFLQRNSPRKKNKNRNEVKVFPPVVVRAPIGVRRRRRHRSLRNFLLPRRRAVSIPQPLFRAETRYIILGGRARVRRRRWCGDRALRENQKYTHTRARARTTKHVYTQARAKERK